MNQLIEAALDYLQHQQRDDGSFESFAAANPDFAGSLRSQPTIFPTALILDCLCSVPSSQPIRDKIARYLVQQQQPDGSWNYWDAASAARIEEPYPDDLDDTACALAALTKHDKTLVGGTQLGRFARLLVAAEQQPGGPYNTWLADIVATPQWQHVDIAVNSNIGYALSLHDVRLSGLESYAEHMLTAGRGNSDYYVTSIPVWYFLTRWLGSQTPGLLRQQITAAVNDPPPSPVQKAMLLSAACHIGITPNALRDLATALRSDSRNGAWPAAALYVDPSYDGQQHYGGSAPLTTALALEALARLEGTKQLVPVVTKRSRTPQLTKELAGIAEPAIIRQYRKLAAALAHSPAAEQVIRPANLVMLPDLPVPARVVSRLNLGSLHGWVAYTLQDAVLDGDSSLIKLTTANTALRRSFDSYLQALPGDQQFRELVLAAFDIMDGANAWELQQARAKQRSKGVIEIRRLPDYQDYRQLAERSWGHSLAVTGVLLYGAGPVPFAELQTFYRHFLIARQLNDDAHDWEADLQAGQLSAVVVMLLSEERLPRSIDVPSELPMLRQRFWTHTIMVVAAKIMAELNLARAVLPALEQYLNSSVLKQWLDDLQAATQAALDGRLQTLEFVSAYAPETIHD